MKDIPSKLNEKFINACINNNINDLLSFLEEGADPFYNDGQALSIFCIENPNPEIARDLAKRISFSNLKKWHKQISATISSIEKKNDDLHDEIELTNTLGKKYIKDMQKDPLYINPFDEIPLDERFIDACINNELDDAIDYLVKGANPFYNYGQALSIFCIENPNPKLVLYLIGKKRLDFINLKKWHEKNIATIKLIEQAYIDGKNNIELTNTCGKKYNKELNKDSILYINPFSQGSFASHCDENLVVLNPDGNCSGISTLYVMQNQKNNSKTNNPIDKLFEEKNLDIENSRTLYTIAIFQKFLNLDKTPFLKTNFANKKEAIQKLDEFILKNTDLVSFSFDYKGDSGHRMVIKTVDNNNYFLFDPNCGEIRICGLDTLKSEILNILEIYHRPQKNSIIQDITFCNYKEMLKPFELESDLNVANKPLAKHYLQPFLEKTTNSFPYSIKNLEMAQPMNKYLEKKFLSIVEKYSQDISSENLQLLATWSVFNNSHKLLKLLCKTKNFDINFLNIRNKSLIEHILDIQDFLKYEKSSCLKSEYNQDNILLKILINNGASYSNIQNSYHIDLTELIDDGFNCNDEITNLSGEISHDN